MSRFGKGRATLLLLLLIMVAWIAVCVRRVYSLRAEDALTVQVREARSDVLLVTGAIFHSGLSGNQVTTQDCGDRIIVRVYLRPADAGSRSNFNVRLKLAASTSLVQLGDTPPYVTVAKACGYGLRLPLRSAAGQTPRIIWRRKPR